MNYEIAFSGSSGNCVRIENILFDIGVPYNKMKYLLKDIDAIFISHEHTDHLNLSTYNQIIKNHFIKIFAPIGVKKRIKEKGLDDSFVIETKNQDEINVKGTIVKIFKAKHEGDVITDTYECYLDDLTSFMYGTDFYDFKDIPQGLYDAIFIEANHDENYRDLLVKQFKGNPPLWQFNSTDRHTTKQEAYEFYIKHRIDENSIYEPLHKSSRFFDLNQEKIEL